MKKNIFVQLLGVLLLALIGLTMNSCRGCKGSTPKSDEQEAYHDYDGVVQDFTAGVSQIQALHRQAMYSLAKDARCDARYEWRNSRVSLNDTVTYESIDGLHVTDVNDVFCYWNTDGPWVQYINSNVKSGVQIPWPIHDVWIEDADMSDWPVKLSAEDALMKLKEYNGVLPKSNFITLRRPVGPKECNPQWTFGDVYNVLFIDAVTGKITDSNPAFSRQ